MWRFDSLSAGLPRTLTDESPVIAVGCELENDGGGLRWTIYRRNGIQRVKEVRLPIFGTMATLARISSVFGEPMRRARMLAITESYRSLREPGAICRVAPRPHRLKRLGSALRLSLGLLRRHQGRPPRRSGDQPAALPAVVPTRSRQELRRRAVR
jgi:hypothetical protein